MVPCPEDNTWWLVWGAGCCFIAEGPPFSGSPSQTLAASVGLGTPTSGPGDLKPLLVQMLFLGLFALSAPATVAFLPWQTCPTRVPASLPRLPSVPILWWAR